MKDRKENSLFAVGLVDGAYGDQPRFPLNNYPDYQEGFRQGARYRMERNWVRRRIRMSPSDSARS